MAETREACGDSETQKHYKDTIATPVHEDSVLPFLDQVQRSEFEATCGESTAVWGVTPEKLGQTKGPRSQLSKTRIDT